MTIVQSITGVWTTIMTVIVELMESASALFYNSESGLTFLGTLCVITLAVGVVLLIINKIADFVRLRG